MLKNYNDMITVNELCEILHICKHAAYALLRDGTIPSVRIGWIYRIPKAEVIKFLKTRG